MSKKVLNIADLDSYEIVEDKKDKPLNIADIGDYEVVDEGISKTASALRGAAQGVTFGFADEIAGGLGALKDIALTDKTLSDFSDVYAQNRDESREAFRQAQEANPKSFVGGMIGGGIASSLIPVVGQATAAARGASTGTMIAKGALSGGLYGVGTSEGESLGDVAIDAAKGATVGGVIGGTVGAITKNASRLPRSGILKSLGADKPRLNKITSSPQDIIESQKRLANTAVKYKLLSDTPQEMVYKVVEAKNRMGNQIGEIIEEASKKSPNAKINVDTILSKFNQQFKEKLESSYNAAGVKHFQKGVDDLKRIAAEPTLKKVKAVQQVISAREREFLGLSELTPDQVLEKSMLSWLKKALNESIYESIESAIPNVLPKYKNAINDYRSLSQLEKFIINKANQEGNRLLSLTDYVIGGGGIASGDPLIAGGTILGKKIVEKAGSLSNTSLFKITQHMEEIAAKNPKWAEALTKAAQRGPQALAAAVFLLSSRDKEFRDFVKKVEEYNRSRNE
jgi:hypothetical protein